MADDLPGATPASQDWSHDWFPYETYRNVHVSYMDRLREEQLVIHDHVDFIEVRTHDLAAVQIEGRLECAFDVVIAVDKWLEVRRGTRGRIEVRGSSYSYHAWVRNGNYLLRYDSAHGLEDLHRHEYDPRSGAETSVTNISLSELPTLDSIVRAAVEQARLIDEEFRN